MVLNYKGLMSVGPFNAVIQVSLGAGLQWKETFLKVVPPLSSHCDLRMETFSNSTRTLYLDEKGHWLISDKNFVHFTGTENNNKMSLINFVTFKDS